MMKAIDSTRLHHSEKRKVLQNLERTVTHVEKYYNPVANVDKLIQKVWEDVPKCDGPHRVF